MVSQGQDRRFATTRKMVSLSAFLRRPVDCQQMSGAYLWRDFSSSADPGPKKKIECRVRSCDVDGGVNLTCLIGEMVSKLHSQADSLTFVVGLSLFWHRLRTAKSALLQRHGTNARMVHKRERLAWKISRAGKPRPRRSYHADRA